MTFRPKSPKDSSLPRHALPRMRPRCCLRYFTFFGINMMKFLEPSLLPATDYKLAVGSRQLIANLENGRADRLRLAPLLLINVAAIDPRLHADHAVGGARLGETIVDVRAQRVQRQTSLQIPLRARDFVPVQPA